MASNYLVRNYRYDQLKNNVVLPKFQRSLVWNKDRKKNFIQTVMQKNPFGILLIYDNPVSHKQQIIDGLQRFTTLKDFESKPLDYLEYEFIDNKCIIKIAEIILNEYQSSSKEFVINQLIDIIRQIFNKYSFLELVQQRLFINLVRKSIFDIYPNFEQSVEGNLIQDELYELWEDLKDKITISDIEIPVIIYQGPPEELPNIFERLNTGGTSLTKYEVFASTWSDIILKDINKEIAKIIEKRFSEIIDKTGMQVDNYNEGDIISSREITLYEYCFALGKLIKNKAPELFGGKKVTKYDSVDSIGFSTLVTFFGMHLKKMNTLDEKINQKIDPKKLNKLTNTILSIYQMLNDIIKYHVGNYNKYIESQIISMAYTLFKIKYDFNVSEILITEKEDYLSDLMKFQKHAPYRMFYDILRNYWSGSGDNKLFEIIQNGLDKNRYMIGVDYDVFESTLKDWATEMLDKPSKTINKESKMFLSYIYMNEYKYAEKHIVNYIYPKKILNNKGIIDGISHIGNLFWISKDKSIYSHKSDILGLVLPEEQLRNIKYYPDKEELIDLEDPDFKFKYRMFIKNRANILIEKFMDNLL